MGMIPKELQKIADQAYVNRAHEIAVLGVEPSAEEVKAAAAEAVLQQIATGAFNLPVLVSEYAAERSFAKENQSEGCSWSQS
jgi:hypothetical protein